VYKIGAFKHRTRKTSTKQILHLVEREVGNGFNNARVGYDQIMLSLGVFRMLKTSMKGFLCGFNFLVDTVFGGGDHFVKSFAKLSKLLF
jgi:hypothetical protein